MNQSDEAKKLMDLKQKRIVAFNDAKERSMAIMSSGRDATLVVCEMYGSSEFVDDEDIKKRIKEWRKFFFYEIYGTDPDEEVKQQLKETLPPKQYLGF
jgi:hypothetical protein